MKSSTTAWIIGTTVGALLIVAAARAFGQEEPRPFSLRWDDPNPPGMVVGYRVYRHTGTNWVVLGTPATNSWSITLAPGLHTLAVTAVSGQGLESDRSHASWLLRGPGFSYHFRWLIRRQLRADCSTVSLARTTGRHRYGRRYQPRTRHPEFHPEKMVEVRESRTPGDCMNIWLFLHV